MAIPEKKPYERLSDYLERSLPAELEAGKSRGKATADIISKFNEEPPREMFAPFIWGATNASGSAGGGGGDADADAFIAAAGITDATQQTALQTLVTTLKSDDVWDKCNAIYPFVGGTATAHKFNLKDPQDTDAAYRLDFNGTWTHDANGAKANGTTSDFADTHWDVTSDASVNEHHNFKYATIPSNISCGYDGQGSPYLIIGTCQQLEFFSGGAVSSNGGDRTGGYAQGILRTASNNAYFYRYLNSNQGAGWNAWITKTDNVGSILSANYYLGKVNTAGFANNDTLGFYTLGGTMTQAEFSLLYDAAQAFNTTLSRDV